MTGRPSAARPWIPFPRFPYPRPPPYEEASVVDLTQPSKPQDRPQGARKGSMCYHLAEPCSMSKSLADLTHGYTLVIYNAGISACQKGEQWQRALTLLSETSEAKLEPDVISILSNCLRHIRHRAWVGGMRLRGRSLGSRGIPPEGFLETVLRRLGSRFGASFGPLGASWVFLEPLGCLLGHPGGLLGRKARIFCSCSSFWASLGALLGPSWAVLRAPWAVLGPSWAVLGRSWGPLGLFWGGLGALLGRLGVSERRKGEDGKNLQTF